MVTKPATFQQQSAVKAAIRAEFPPRSSGVAVQIGTRGVLYLSVRRVASREQLVTMEQLRALVARAALAQGCVATIQDGGTMQTNGTMLAIATMTSEQPEERRATVQEVLDYLAAWDPGTGVVLQGDGRPDGNWIALDWMLDYITSGES